MDETFPVPLADHAAACIAASAQQWRRDATPGNAPRHGMALAPWRGLPVRQAGRAGHGACMKGVAAENGE